MVFGKFIPKDWQDCLRKRLTFEIKGCNLLTIAIESRVIVNKEYSMKTLEITGKVTFKLADLYIEAQDGFDIDKEIEVKELVMQYIGAEHLRWNINADEDLCIDCIFEYEDALV